MLARDLVTDHDILQVDMRNHGLSGRADEMTYAAMAQDLWIRSTPTTCRSDPHRAFDGRQSGHGADTHWHLSEFPGW